MAKNKKIAAVVLLGVSLLFSACANETVPQEKNEVAQERAYNEKMTETQFVETVTDFSEFATDLGDSFMELSNLSGKYAVDINNAEVFDWSQYWDFRELKEKITVKCENLLSYDDSHCNKELQRCFDELKSSAYHVKEYFEKISKEMPTDQLNMLINQLCNDITIAMENATIYMTEGQIAYLESNDGDEALIQSLKDSIDGIDSSFQNAYGSVNTKCIISNCGHAIALTGDTNCCILHSNKCMQCGCYIDGDALFCVDCLTSGYEKATEKKNRKKSSAGGCQYKYFDGSVCGSNTKYGQLCEKHFKQLDEIYKSYTEY